MPGMALLVVSHRTDVMAAMDRVLTLEDGCLRELPGRVNDRPVAQREEVTMNDNLQIEELSPAEEAELLGGAAIGSEPGSAHVMIGDQ
jgi:ABC-type protease/lipase transport system fused ATPase/permease subunit